MKKMTLIDLIIDQYERSSKWNNITSGNASFRIEEKHYKQLGKIELVSQANELEKEGLLKIRWVKGYYNVDIEKVEYPLIHMEHFYQLSNREPKYQIVSRQQQIVMNYYNMFKSSWIRKYVETEVLTRLEKGSYEQDEDKIHLLFQCLFGIDQLEAPIFKRVFSKRYLKNSKIFEKQLQTKIIGIAKKYSDEIDEEMEDSDILSQLYIEEYSQELNIKGSLLIEIEGNIIDTGFYRYGTVLNSQTLKNVSIADKQNIKKILTIENKANFEAEPYEEGTLIIFSHGYFTPLERNFLIQLKEKLKEKRNEKLIDNPVKYYHSGDLDYGGVCIFKYIKNRIFPALKPYRMDKETFEKYQSFGESIEESTLEKLKKCEEPLLQEVMNRIIETGLVIEQEAYL